MYEKRLDEFEDKIFLTNEEAMYHEFNNIRNVKVDWVGQYKSEIAVSDGDGETYFQSRLASE